MERFSVKIVSDVATVSTVRIVSILGQVFNQNKVQLIKGENIIYLNMPANAANGTYVLQAIVNGESMTQKMIFNK